MKIIYYFLIKVLKIINSFVNIYFNINNYFIQLKIRELSIDDDTFSSSFFNNSNIIINV